MFVRFIMVLETLRNPRGKVGTLEYQCFSKFQVFPSSKRIFTYRYWLRAVYEYMWWGRCSANAGETTTCLKALSLSSAGRC